MSYVGEVALLWQRMLLVLVVYARKLPVSCQVVLLVLMPALPAAVLQQQLWRQQQRVLLTCRSDLMLNDLKLADSSPLRALLLLPSCSGAACRNRMECNLTSVKLGWWQGRAADAAHLSYL
jgi:hypothetical protein